MSSLSTFTCNYIRNYIVSIKIKLKLKLILDLKSILNLNVKNKKEPVSMTQVPAEISIDKF